MTGAAVDVALFLEGEPECMIEYHSEPDKMIEVLVSNAASASVGADYLFNRGSAIASVVYSLLCSNYRVRLELITCIIEDGDYHLTRIVLSEFGDVLDPSRLAYWLVHPAALRRSLLRLNETNDADCRERFGFYKEGGYGYPINVPQELIPEGALYFPVIDSSNEHNFSSPRAARGEVHRTCTDYGLHLGG